MTPLVWHERSFDDLTTRELYAILALRASVFVVEQRCVYQDVDGADAAARHVWATRATDDRDEIVAYLRIVPAGAKYAEASIGRVVVAPGARGGGLARELMQRGIAAAGAAVRIGAQAHLESFYRSLGFVPVSGVYDEDGIPHVEMLRAAT